MKTWEDLAARVAQIRGYLAAGDAPKSTRASLALFKFLDEVIIPLLRDGGCGPACRRLSKMRRDFVHLLVGVGGKALNQTDAYEGAGYKTKTRKASGNSASRLLEDDGIREAIAEHEASRAAETADKKAELTSSMELMWRPDSPEPGNVKVQAGRLHSELEGWKAADKLEISHPDGMAALNEIQAAAADGNDFYAREARDELLELGRNATYLDAVRLRDQWRQRWAEVGRRAVADGLLPPPGVAVED